MSQEYNIGIHAMLAWVDVLGCPQQTPLVVNAYVSEKWDV
jgi:hypothetical protein